MNKIILGDSAKKLKGIPENSIDLVVTDPPYRYGFMGKSWDKKQDFTEIWSECLRVLKPGGFAYIMNAPRSDCQLLLLKELAEVGFNIEFSPIFWTYASGFPKAANMSKLIDKRLGVEQEVIGNYEHPGRKNRSYQTTSNVFSGDRKGDKIEQPKWEEHRNTSKTRQNPFQSGQNLMGKKHEVIQGLFETKPSSPEAQRFDGGYAGFQPKPAVELINVVMKPITEKSYIDQALKNGKGVSWFDDCRIPYEEVKDMLSMFKANPSATPGDSEILNYNTSNQGSVKKKYEEGNKLKKQKIEDFKKFKKKMIGGRANHHYSAGGKNMGGLKPTRKIPFAGDHDGEWDDAQILNTSEVNLKGRFPANLLISDNILDSGKIRKSKPSIRKSVNKKRDGFLGEIGEIKNYLFGYNDSGDFSRYFSLDAWWKEHIRNLPKELRETFPFLYCPKPTKAEKNKGLTGKGKKVTDGRKAKVNIAFQRGETIRKNIHPTGKPIKLMSYLIILGSRPKDIILDPFAGSGTTGIACKLEDRRYILIEKDPEYFEIMKARLKAHHTQHKLF